MSSIEQTGMTRETLKRIIVGQDVAEDTRANPEETLTVTRIPTEVEQPSFSLGS